ncbi:MAG: tyrosine-type recombinase/integrase [Janthinobacterium lividum]
MAPDGQSASFGKALERDKGNDETGQTLSKLADPVEAVALALAQHAHAARGAYSLNTERALRADVTVFTGWCVAAELGSLPAAPSTVAAFVDAMGAVRAPATVRRYISSVATFHHAARLPNPCQDDAVRLALKRLHRARGRAQAQAAPLTRDLVDRMLAAAGDGVRDLRNRALLAVAYDSLCRRSELVALQRADLEAGQYGEGTLTIRRSKTDQEGIGQLRYVAPDTMRHVAAWLAVAEHTDGALFRTVGKAGTIGGPLDPGDVARVFKAMAKAAGIARELVAAISGHSSRVGAAQDQVQHGVELPAVMQAGGWTSPTMVARYSAKLQVRRGGAAKLALLQNRT